MCAICICVGGEGKAGDVYICVLYTQNKSQSHALWITGSLPVTVRMSTNITVVEEILVIATRQQKEIKDKK